MRWIIEQIANPLIRRAGTLGAGYLTGLGVPSDEVGAIVNGLTIGGLVLVDLATSYLYRKGR